MWYCASKTGLKTWHPSRKFQSLLCSSFNGGSGNERCNYGQSYGWSYIDPSVEFLCFNFVLKVAASHQNIDVHINLRSRSTKLYAKLMLMPKTAWLSLFSPGSAFRGFGGFNRADSLAQKLFLLPAWVLRLMHLMNLSCKPCYCGQNSDLWWRLGSKWTKHNRQAILTHKLSEIGTTEQTKMFCPGTSCGWSVYLKFEFNNYSPSFCSAKGWRFLHSNLTLRWSRKVGSTVVMMLSK